VDKTKNFKVIFLSLTLWSVTAFCLCRAVYLYDIML